MTFIKNNSYAVATVARRICSGNRRGLPPRRQVAGKAEHRKGWRTFEESAIRSITSLVRVDLLRSRRRVDQSTLLRRPASFGSVSFLAFSEFQTDDSRRAGGAEIDAAVERELMMMETDRFDANRRAGAPFGEAATR
jgi:hypothetical protein